MRVDIPLEIDLGPLAWVKDEVTLSLGRARRDVESLVANQPILPEALQRALDEVHQTSGAFELIGIEGLATFTREIERHLKSLVEAPQAESAPKVLASVENALRRLSSHLEEVFSGAPCKPTLLTREYAALHRQRGSEAGASDLFFPDLNRKPRRLEGVSPIPPDRLPGYLQVARRGYERGLLDWLRGNPTGIVAMRENIESVERAFPLPAQRSFWWAVGALFHAVEESSVAPSVGVKQLSARIDLQVRRFVEGSTKISDRLRREVLFHIARAESARAEVKQVQALYDLDRLIPSPGVNLRSAIDFVALRPAIDALIATVTEARNTWQRVLTGHNELHEPLRTKCAEASTQAAELSRPQLAGLLAAMGEVISSSGSESVSDRVGIEFSAALLFAETALANFAGRAEAYEHEAASLVEQLRVAGAGLDSSDQTKPVNAITRRVQERESFKALVGEVRENLIFVESSIDAWVRGNATLDVASLTSKLNQVVGVFSIADQPVAAQATRNAESLIGGLDGSQQASDQEAAIGKVAEQLSQLGFYIDAKRLQPEADHTHLLEPARQQIDPNGATGDAQPEAESASVEVDVRRQRKQLSNLVAQWQGDPGNVQTRTEVERSLRRLLDDAKLLGNADLVVATRDALNALELAQSDSSALLLTQSIASSDTLPVPGVSTQTQSLLNKDAPALDSAMVEIFLEESDEILANLAPLISTLGSDPADRDALVSARRSFHTLKGSGRMVGLLELGDAAWDIEQQLNHRIQSETAVHATELEMLSTARMQFSLWVASVRKNLTDHGFDRAPLDNAVAYAKSQELVEVAPMSSMSTLSFAPLAAGSGVLAAAAISAQASQPNALPDIDSLFSFDIEPSEVPALSTPSLDLPEKKIVEKAEIKFGLSGPPQANGDRSVADWEISEDEEVARLFGVGSPLDTSTQSESLDHHIAPDVSITAFGEPLTAAFAPTVAVASGVAVRADATPEVSAATPVRNQYQLPETLRTLVTEEAATYLATLTSEVERMQIEVGVKPGDDMIRAAHTLKGMHLSVGLTDIGELAGGLESALVALKQRAYEEDALAPIATAVAALQSLCQCVRDQIEPDEFDRDFVEIAKSSLEQLHEGSELLSADALAHQFGVDPQTIAPSLAPAVRASMQHNVPQATIENFGAQVSPAALHADVGHTTLASSGVVPTTGAVLGLGAAAGVVAAFAESHGASDLAILERRDEDFGLTETKSALESPEKLFSPAPRTLIEESVSKPELSANFVVPASGAKSDQRNTAAALVAGAAMLTPLVPRPNPAVVAAAATEPTFQAQPAVQAQLYSAPPVRVDPIADIRDDLEPSVLEIFIEEAHELFPTASAQLRQWRSAPADRETGNALKRTMHTLKGSARMAGAMRLGELAHRLESRLETDDFNRAVPVKTFDEIESDLDSIAFVLDRLEKGESNVPLPGYAAAVAQSSFIPVVETETESMTAAVAVEAQSSNLLVEIGETPKISEITAFVPSAQISEPALPVTGLAPLPQMSVAAPVTGDALRWLSDENASQNQVLRVRADAIERLADETGEVSISRARMDSELKSLRGNLTELTSSVMRLRAQVREIEIQAETQIQSRLSQVQDTDSGFDPLEFDRFTRFQELTRSLAEGVNDVATVQQSIVSNLDTTDAALNAQGRIARSLQNQLQSIRTVAFTSLRERLYRVMRQSARDLGKRANMEIRGGELSLDRSVIERLAPLVEHVLRNALAHGVEAPSARTAAGKSETGEISIELRQQGNLVEISISDDGAGFDVAAIRRKAIAQRLTDDAQSLSDAQWIDYVFLAGFTTASEVTAVAGRGVGMDVVRTEINALGGRVEAHHVEGKGARFNLYVPLTLTLLNAVMVRVGRHRYGIPSSMVETVKSVRAAEYAVALATGSIQHGRERIRFAPMHPCVGEVLAPREENLSQAIVIRSGSTVIALDVDAVLGNQEVVLKRMGPQLGRVPGLLGVSLLGDGDIVLLYNPITLVTTQAQRATLEASAASATDVDTSTPTAASASLPDMIEIAPTAAVALTPRKLAPVVPIRPLQLPAEKPLVMVVDDSLTVRKITTRFLEREGFRAVSAKDGMEALTLLSDHKPQVILLDIEMPRMDGFEFTRAAKGDAALREIPIIMITSRTAEKHRNHAKELGVDVYLGKPYQDDELLKHIHSFVRSAETT